MYNYEQKLVGKKVLRIYMNEDFLKFETDNGNVVFWVDGDCCSSSVFYDFYGVKKLLNNGSITEVKEVELTTDDKKLNRLDKENSDDSIACYGFQITTEDKELGLVTSVFSFRNYSNGYYGGSLEEASDDKIVLPEITDDVYETVEDISRSKE